ncbi:MAG: DUF6702 family protein [Flavobacteriaceae bacterium]|nr:DUF6702 family protein [Flavobacteriaceae bacterium]
MKFFNWFLLFSVMVSLSFTMHKYYVSMTEIKYVEEKKEIQITMRFFIDDFEKVLGDQFKKPFALATEKELKDTDKFINFYLIQNFRLTINGKAHKFHFLGKEYENDVVYLYAEVTDVQSIQSIEIQNRMLFEGFEDQQNYIKLDVNSQKKTFILTKQIDKELIKF